MSIAFLPRPGTLEEALRLLDANPAAQPIAGGQFLVPALGREARPQANLMAIDKLPELSGITKLDGRLTIGAGECHARVTSSDVVAEAIPALAALVGSIGDPQVRARGTLGGALCSGDPLIDYAAACLGLGAVLQTSRGELSAEDFFALDSQPRLLPADILKSVAFQIPNRAGYAKLKQSAAGYALVGVFVSQKEGDVRVAVIGGWGRPVRSPVLESVLASRFAPDSIVDDLPIEEGLLDDDLASADYRRALVLELTRRAVHNAI
ncbi:MAG: FAD binding domain-containing protein [Pseudomonadota bacterium]